MERDINPEASQIVHGRKPDSFEDPRFPKVVGRTRPTDPVLRTLEEMTMAEPGRIVVKG